MKHWLECSKMGKIVDYTAFVPFKQPIVTSLEVILKPEEQFRLSEVKTKYPSIGLIINLCNQEPNFLPSFRDEIKAKLNVEMVQIACPDDKTPSDEQVDEFIECVNKFTRKNPDNLIGVYCFDGVKTTGYLICHYLAQKWNLSMDTAIANFERARESRLSPKTRRALHQGDNINETEDVTEDPGHCDNLAVEAIEETDEMKSMEPLEVPMMRKDNFMKRVEDKLQSRRCTYYGSRVNGSPFVPFKRPRDYNSVNIEDLIQSYPEIGLVICLNETKKYELKLDRLPTENVYCTQDRLPTDKQVAVFLSICEKFLSQFPSKLIAVCCETGVTLTGFMICEYMERNLQLDVTKAVKLFQKARGHEFDPKCVKVLVRNAQRRNKDGPKPAIVSHIKKDDLEKPKKWRKFSCNERRQRKKLKNGLNPVVVNEGSLNSTDNAKKEISISKASKLKTKAKTVKLLAKSDNVTHLKGAIGNSDKEPKVKWSATDGGFVLSSRKK